MQYCLRKQSFNKIGWPTFWNVWMVSWQTECWNCCPFKYTWYAVNKNLTETRLTEPLIFWCMEISMQCYRSHLLNFQLLLLFLLLFSLMSFSFYYLPLCRYTWTYPRTSFPVCLVTTWHTWFSAERRVPKSTF